MEIRWNKEALKELQGLEHDLADRILSKVEEASCNPRHFLEGLSGSRYYKLRAGDHRIILDWQRKEKILNVLMLGQREEIYKRMNRNV